MSKLTEMVKQEEDGKHIHCLEIISFQICGSSNI